MQTNVVVVMVIGLVTAVQILKHVIMITTTIDDDSCDYPIDLFGLSYVDCNGNV